MQIVKNCVSPHLFPASVWFTMGFGEWVSSGPAPQLRLLVTLPLLRHIRPRSLREPAYKESMWWATATTCMCFRADEITTPTVSSYVAMVHLSWGDVSISVDHCMVCVILKQSKTDQYGTGVYWHNRQLSLPSVWLFMEHLQRPFLCLAVGISLAKSHFVQLVEVSPDASWSPRWWATLGRLFTLGLQWPLGST